MQLKSSFRYQFRDLARATGMFYLIYFGVSMVLTIGLGIATGGIESGSGMASMGGIEMAGITFIFVLGLCSFKEAFCMLAQNGVSRRTFFTGHLMVSVVIALAMAVIDRILDAAMWGVSQIFPNLYYTSFFALLFELDRVTGTLFTFLVSFAGYLAIMSIGFFITTMFFRLSKLGKALVGAGVPVTLLILLPAIDNRFAGGAIGRAFTNFMRFAFGWDLPVPWPAVVTLLIIAALANLFAWLLMRRAVVRV